MSEIKKIPFVDLTAQYHSIREEINRAVQSVIHDTAFILGKYVREFEESFAKYCQTKHCIGVANGTDALFIALKSLNIGCGDEVIVPANTFIATSEAVTMTGAKVVFVDCDPKTYNMDVTQVSDRITEKTKAIIPVHLYGQPAELETLKKIAQKFGLKIIQDCAQAHGSEIHGKSLATFGDILCFSFYPGKNLGAYGDAGAIVTDDDTTAEKCRMIANHGRMSKYDHEFEGVNSRMDGIQGAVLDVKLKYLSEWTEKRRNVAECYDQRLKGVGNIVTPYVLPDVKHVYHLYVIRSDKRDQLQNYLKDKGIATGVHYPIALPNLQAYRYLGHGTNDFPIASGYQNQILSLPMYPELTLEMIEYVTEAIADFESGK